MLHFLKLIYNFLKNKKVLIASHDLSNTGASRALLSLAEILKEEGFFVLIHSPGKGALKTEFENLGIPVCILNFKRLKLIFPLLKFFNFIICNTIVSYKFVDLLQKTNQKYLWWIHESSFLEHFIKETPEIIPIIEKAKNTYIVSALAKSYMQKYKTDVKILGFGIKDISKNYQESNVENDKIVFCCPSSIIPIKGQDILINAFESLTDSDKQKCEIRMMGQIGDLDFFNKIKKMSAKHNNINILNTIPHDEALKEIKQANAIILPSRGDSYSTVTIEALMFGKTVICSTATGVSSSITNEVNGFVFDINNPEELTKYMKKIIDNPDIIDKTEARNLFLEKFQLETYKPKVKKLLKDLEI